ncbi:MAG TPA: hypothetical protein DC048_01805 [Planctomycetaceae bacterium]|nr:hypothetical protein [Planctomycetaceae bacterium]
MAVYVSSADPTRTAALAAEAAAADLDFFESRVRPLFVAHCAECHSRTGGTVEGGLSFDTRGDFLAAADVAAAGRPDDSLLIHAVRYDGDLQMPPDGKLPAAAIATLEEWVRRGLPWPDDGGPARAEAFDIARRTAEHWCWQPPRASPPPAVTRAEWCRDDIDRFVLARLESAGLTPADEAPRATLVRRAAAALTGLPPDPALVAGALADTGPDWFDRVVDALLASPHFGERFARHWLDVTRYAETRGHEFDYPIPNAWRYRDWVVRAFNDDMPYDRFVRDQIAGDEIDPGDPDRVVATGFLRMGPWELTGMEVERIARQRFLDDVVNAVGETFLAHSLQCARCHDHKFDPVPTRDYYRVQAVFATTQLAERSAPFLPTENTAGFTERTYLERARAEHVATLERLDAVLLENAARWFAEENRDPAAWNAAVVEARRQEAARGPDAVRRRPYPDVFANTRRLLLDRGVPEREFPPKLVGFTPEQFGLERVARKGLERLAFEFDRYEPYALSVYAGRTRTYKTVFTPLRVPEDRLTAGDLEATTILVGGDPFTAGEPVTPGVLSVLGTIQSTPIPDTIEGRRRAFAEWVASADNPLTTRAIVNRVWMWHFGEPLAGNPNNFGGTGRRPTHPELLDWLAATFVEQGWSFKALHRTIMSTEAYRRSSTHPHPERVRELDPLGASDAVFRPRRLGAEEIRDAMLAATGELNPAVGGIPNRPEMHVEAALQPRQVMGTFASAWVPNPLPEQRHRRSLYALVLRGLGDPMMETFNAPAPDFSCERREATTVTPQVFALFNGRATHARALALAARALGEAAGDEEAIRRCFLLALGRDATPAEVGACLAHWREMTVVHARGVPPRATPPRDVLREAVEENTGETFSFRETLHAHADFVPDLEPADCDARTRGLADVCVVLFNTSEFTHVD